jgi:hypothetical protein
MAKRGDIDKHAFRREGTREQTAVRGFQTPINTRVITGGFQMVETSLLRANMPIPRQWLVTLAAPMRGPQPLPYRATFDGTSTAPDATNFGAPPLVSVGQPLETLQVTLRWGAGGVRSQTAFDYPMLGGTFSVTADSMDVGVTSKYGSAVTFGSAGEIPIVAGWYVEGAPVDDTPMGWSELPCTIAALGNAYFSVKPYAKELLVSITDADQVRVEWQNAAGATLAVVRVFANVATSPGDQPVLQVPRQAVVARVVNDGASPVSVYLEWGIGLS